MFDKVWHEGITFKLRQNDISVKLLNLSCDFLRNRKQKVVLNGQDLTWTNVNAGVPQLLILGRLLFMIYNNDLVDELSPNEKLFADANLLLFVVQKRYRWLCN